MKVSELVLTFLARSEHNRPLGVLPTERSPLRVARLPPIGFS